MHYVSDADTGIERHRHGKTFAYVRASGSQVRDHATLAASATRTTVEAMRKIERDVARYLLR